VVKVRGTRRRCEDGYNLLVLMVLVTVMNVAVAVALPSWSQFVQREKEAEAVFRGLQYAEAIRVFQKRHSRLPNTLEELIEIEPRSIRKLYSNPLHEGGQWGLLIQAATAGGGPQARGARGGVRQPIAPPGQRGNTPESGGAGFNPELVGAGRYVAVPPAAEGDLESGLRGPRGRTTGPIVGVYPASDTPSRRTFFGQDNHSAWHFTVSLIPLPVVVGDRALPRVTSEWIGKAFREDLTKPEGGGGAGPADARSRARERGRGDEVPETEPEAGDDAWDGGDEG
jgi:type II secretory pathway pseudopilin PulG